MLISCFALHSPVLVQVEKEEEEFFWRILTAGEGDTAIAERVALVTDGAAADGAVVAGVATGVRPAYGSRSWRSAHARVHALVAVASLIRRTVL